MTIGTYFSGGGCLEQGIKECGAEINPLFAVEYDAKIAYVYRQNHGNHIICANVVDVDYAKLPRVDWFHASPVCCRFSKANTANTLKEDNKKYIENDIDSITADATAKYIEYHKPQFVTIENVKEYVGSDSLRIITRVLDAVGYVYETNVYRDGEIGGYTKRDRMILRATLKRCALFPRPKLDTHNNGEWVGLVMPYVHNEKTRIVSKGQFEKLNNSIKSDLKSFHYEPTRNCVINLKGNPNRCFDIIYTDDFFLTVCSSHCTFLSYHYGNEPFDIVHRITDAQAFMRVQGLNEYKTDNNKLCAYIAGNGIPKSFVENVMLPFVFQSPTGEISQSLLL